MSLSKLQIFCDFDGTITTSDTVDFLLEQLATPEWKTIEARWESGEIGSRECMGLQIPLIQGGLKAIDALLPLVRIDPSFPRFVQWCANQDIPLVIVSEGLDYVIHTLLAREGLAVSAVWSNHLVVSDDGNTLSLAFPNPPITETCRAGLCKCQILTQADLGVERVVIGDGLSDLCWSANATHLYAKSTLLRHCMENNIECHPFDSFQTIQLDLEYKLLHSQFNETNGERRHVQSV